jgi:hypothetical protein
MKADNREGPLLAGSPRVTIGGLCLPTPGIPSGEGWGDWYHRVIGGAVRVLPESGVSTHYPLPLQVGGHSLVPRGVRRGSALLRHVLLLVAVGAMHWTTVRPLLRRSDPPLPGGPQRVARRRVADAAVALFPPRTRTRLSEPSPKTAPSSSSLVPIRKASSSSMPVGDTR